MTVTSIARSKLSAPWRHIDVVMIGSAVLLMVAGAMMIYSAKPAYLGRQLIWIAAGCAALLAVSTADYRRFKGYAPVLYWGLVAVLVLLLVIGTATRGTRAWFNFGFFALQPSEFGKPIFILFLASIMNDFREEMTRQDLTKVFGIAIIPIFLIFIEPDLGQALVYIAVLLGMLLVAGAKARVFAVIALVAVLGGVVAINSSILEDYQRQRLTVFATQDDKSRVSDPAAYNLNQSKIAIGSGGWFGKGYRQGSQTKLSYVPEQYTDFIFTAIGEEFGFFGGATILFLFALIVWRGLRSAALSRDLYGTLVAAGITSLFLFQVFQNTGMTMGIMPITGIPLPFMSYGGSTMISSAICLGLLNSIHMRRFQ